MTTVPIRISTRERLQQLSAERLESVDQVIAYGLALIEREAGRRRAAGLEASRTVVDPTARAEVAAALAEIDESRVARSTLS
jgi:hypothetical protein